MAARVKRERTAVPVAPPATPAGPAALPAPPRLLDRLRDALRLHHHAIRTEQAYVDWARRFMLFHGRRHPVGLGADLKNS